MRSTSILIALLLSANPSSVLASSNYATSCDPYIPEGNKPQLNQIMSADCTRISAKGGLRTTTLNLNYCLGNNGGDLIPMNNGDFGKSCTNCNKAVPRQKFPYFPNFVVTTSTYYCQCSIGPTLQLIESPVNLNSVVANVNGHLECFGHVGS